MPNRPRILIVDDHRDTADLMEARFQSDGYLVRTAYDGAEVIDAVIQFQPDVVLMDIGLPGLDGYEAARRIRNLPNGDRLILVAVTGWGEQQDKLLSGRAGYNHHFVKPVHYDELLRLVQSTTV